MITLEDDRLVFRFSEVHEQATCAIGFQRTLRIPDDESVYQLPPGLGSFPLRHLDDFASRVPEDWARRGGVVMPMHQAEALWLQFGGRYFGGSYPMAVKVATGKRCAITGEPWSNHLNQDPQDYVVLPEQPWLDGYSVAAEEIRQFVAMRLGEGYTVEEQITDEAEHGGLQLMVFPMKAERYEELEREKRKKEEEEAARRAAAPRGPKVLASMEAPDMGLAMGGRMRQQIYKDPYGLRAWDQRLFSRCFVTIANSQVWLKLTGEAPPTEPPTAADYSNAGLPWFDYFDADAKLLEGSDELRGVKSVKDMGADQGEAPLPENEPAKAARVISLGPSATGQVREMAEPL